MTIILRYRCATWLMMVVALLLSVVPFNVEASHNEATRTPVTFTATIAEILNEGEETSDEAGGYSLRGFVERDEVTGDLQGEFVITVNVDFQPAGGCTEESCPGNGGSWGHVVITDANGVWEGTYFEVWSDVEGFAHTKLILQGLRGNAGKSIVAERNYDAETDETAVFEGFMVTMAPPIQGLNISLQLCSNADQRFNGDESSSGGFLGSGAVSGAGSAAGQFFDAGAPGTQHSGLWGVTTLTDAQGTITIEFTGLAQNNGDASIGWGYFIIVGGTGAYADLYGHGRTIASASESGQCSSGFGVHVNYIGEAHYN